MVLRQQQPKAVILLFHTGKLVCTGATSTDHARQAIHHMIRGLRSHNIITDCDVSITIQNVVATGSVGGKVDLEKAAFLLERTLYEPEQFPGVIYRMEAPSAVMLIYVTGRIICTGAKQEDDIREAVQRLQRQLERDAIIH